MFFNFLKKKKNHQGYSDFFEEDNEVQLEDCITTQQPNHRQINKIPASSLQNLHILPKEAYAVYSVSVLAENCKILVINFLLTAC